MKLGLQDLKTQRIYIGQEQTSPWYTWDHDSNTAIPILNDSLVGYLEQIELFDKEYKKTTNSKIVLSFRADRIFKVQSGLSTWFTKTLFLRLLQLSDADIKQPIGISPYLGEEDNLVFCSVRNCRMERIEVPDTFNYQDLDEDYVINAIKTIQKKLES